MQNPPTTIWNQLDGWAQSLLPWQRFVLGNAVRAGQLTDEQVDRAYALFLQDNGLVEACESPIEVPVAITGRPTEAARGPIWLTRVGELRAINALPSSAELTFSPTLTVVYGGNGVGKSGFTRILSNVCFSRSQHPILPNIYEEEIADSPAASIFIADGTQKETQLAFDGFTEHSELKRIAVFDSTVARTHLLEQSPLGFKPAGFDVFPEMARVYTELVSRLKADIERRDGENTFVNSFVEPTSPISEFVAGLNATTNLNDLQSLAAFGETQAARLDEVQRQIRELQSKSIAEAIEQLEEAKRDIAALRKRLTQTRSPLTEEKCTTYREELADFMDKARSAAVQGAETFSRDFFRGVGTPEWETFLTAARALAQIERQDYPRDADHCLFCHRLLDPTSAALIRRFWGFLASEVRSDAEKASARLDRSIQALKALRLDFFSADTTAHAHITRLNPTLAKQIDAFLKSTEADRAAIVAVLECGAGEIPVARSEGVESALTELIMQIETDIMRLREEKIEDAIKALEAERISLRHRQVLKQLLPDAQKYVSDLAWVKKASGAPKRSLNTRPLTDKESEFFETVIAQEYKDRLADECKSLDCNLPVEFRTQGQRGETIRSLSIKGGYNPDAILSEGEQRAVALADFLTEVSLNPANTGIVLDDPVTSQDHQRKDHIARRLVVESKNRQVIIFTHDLVFLTMLAKVSNDENVDLLTHWIERDGEGRPGQISLDDCPATTPQYRNTQKAKKTLAEARAAAGSGRVKLVQRGMAELRRTIEEIIPHFLLKQIVNRWTDRVIVTGLKKVNWDDSLVSDIIRAYEEQSAHIEGHSHTEERAGGLPEPKDLEGMIVRVDDLIKRAKAGKAPA